MSLAQLVKIEVYKLQRFDYYLFAVLYLLLILGMPIGINGVFRQGVSGSAAVGFMHLVSVKLIFFGLIVAQAREYTNDVNRKRLLNGYKRHELFISQLIVLGIYTVTLVVLSVVAMPLIALVMGDMSLYADTPLYWYLGLVLSNLAWGALAIFLINIFKRPLWAILAYLGYGFVEFILKLVGQFQEASGGYDKLIYFSPMELFNRLKTFEELNGALMYTVIGYILILLLVSFWLFRRRDF